MKVVQIGSLFYGVIFAENGDMKVISEGYHTYEMCFSALKMYEGLNF